MGGNKHSGGSAAPWKGTDCGTFGGLRQFCVDFVYPESCLSHLDLGRGNKALFILCNGLGLTSGHEKFSFLDCLGLCVLCGLPLRLELSFGGAANSGGSWTRAGGSVDLAFL
jgi:hypothetical protein